MKIVSWNTEKMWLYHSRIGQVERNLKTLNISLFQISKFDVCL